MVKVYRVTLMVIDHDALGEDGIRREIESARYANHCMYPQVMQAEGKDIGEWEESHPLNSGDARRRAAAFEDLFWEGFTG